MKYEDENNLLDIRKITTQNSNTNCLMRVDTNDTSTKCLFNASICRTTNALVKYFTQLKV